MEVKKLTKENINDLLEFLSLDYFKFDKSKEKLEKYCIGGDYNNSQTYGLYDNSKIVSIMTISYFYVFPHEDNPQGLIAHVSGAYTLPSYRGKKCASLIYEKIEEDAKGKKVDYICGDCTEDGKNFYLSKGFIFSEEYRLWKPF